MNEFEKYVHEKLKLTWIKFALSSDLQEISLVSFRDGKKEGYTFLIADVAIAYRYQYPPYANEVRKGVR